MPRGDGTGPDGRGPRTGRGLGFCSGYGVPGFANGGPRRGAGLGRGFGRRFNRGGARWAGFNSPSLTREQEKKILEANLAELDAEREEILDRIKDLE